MFYSLFCYRGIRAKLAKCRRTPAANPIKETHENSSRSAQVLEKGQAGTLSKPNLATAKHRHPQRGLVGAPDSLLCSPAPHHHHRAMYPDNILKEERLSDFLARAVFTQPHLNLNLIVNVALTPNPTSSASLPPPPPSRAILGGD